MTRPLFDKLLQRVVQKIKANKMDVPFNVHTKVPLDIAVNIVVELVTSPHPADYFTVFAARYFYSPHGALAWPINMFLITDTYCRRSS